MYTIRQAIPCPETEENVDVKSDRKTDQKKKKKKKPEAKETWLEYVLLRESDGQEVRARYLQSAPPLPSSQQ